MTTSQLRAALKEVDPRASVTSIGEGMWTIHTEHELAIVRAHIRALGLEEIDHDIKGSRYDWKHVLTVSSKQVAS